MLKFTEVKGRDIGDIKIFALSTCGWCKKTKAFLNDKGIAYSFIDVDLVPENEVDEVREQQLSHNPRGSFPTIVVNSDYCIIGYDVAELEKLTGE